MNRNLKGGTMRRSFKLVLGLTAVVLMTMPLTSTFASRSVQGSILDMSTPTDPFAGRCADTRIWSASDANALTANGLANCATGVNACTSAAAWDSVNMICKREYKSNTLGTLTGGYVGHQEDKFLYANDLEPQNMFILWENIQNPTASNYVPYYYIAGQVASDSDLGKIQDQNCVGTVAVACFLPGSSGRSPKTITNTRLGSLAPQGGFEAIPTPTVTGVSGGVVSLSWQAHAYATGESVADPFKTHRLWRLVDNNGNNTCDPPLQDAAGWMMVGDVTGTTTTNDITGLAGDCVFYALQLVFNGPANLNSFGGGTGELGTQFRSTSSAGVSINPLAVQITNFDAKYAGKNRVEVTWTGLIESGITGYYVATGLSPSGPFDRTSDFVAATGDGSNYNLATRVARVSGRTYYYQLQIVHADGSTTTLGPAGVTLPVRQGE